MLGETHKGIAEQIAIALNLNKRQTDLLVVGSTRPDSWDRDFPHHKGKDFQIIRNLLDARRLYVNNDDECYAKLGVALHYVQDKWTLRPRTKDKHTEYEREMANSPYLDDSRFEEFIKDSTMPTKAIRGYLDLLQETIKKEKRVSFSEWEWNDKYYTFSIYIRGFGVDALRFALQDRPSDEWSNPTIDYNFAFRISLELSSYVLRKGSDIWEERTIDRHDERWAEFIEETRHF